VEAQRRLRESDLTRQVGQAQAQLARTRLQAGIARRAVALAGEALSQAQAVSREGRGEAVAVDRAQLSLSAAEDELALARRDHVDARLQLLAIEGNILSALSAEPPATPEP
jgi:outer membrane protein TolC